MEAMEIDKNINQIIELQYFGSIDSYLSLYKASFAVFWTDLDYEKSLHPNRMWLSGPNGLLRLTIPLVGGRNRKQPLNAVRISYSEPWQRVHWRSLHDSYRKSPWFESYAHELEALYQKQPQFLLDWNRLTMEWALKKLKVKCDILSESKQDLPGATRLGPVTEPLQAADFRGPVYPQVFEDRHGFVPNLSILDLLFCEGPAAKSYLGLLEAHRSGE